LLANVSLHVSMNSILTQNNVVGEFTSSKRLTTCKELIKSLMSPLLWHSIV